MIMSNLPLVNYYEEYIAESLDLQNSETNTMIAQRGQSPQSPSKHITVVDVYDLAASIGKDFERLIELHGNECVRGIMPKVISALETLESLANNNDKENEEIISLQKTIDRLEQEKHTKQLQSTKFEEELEQIEETYKKDITELREMVKTLMCENRTLSSTVSSLPIIESSGIPFKEEDVRLMLELKDSSVKQKEEIKSLQKDNEHYATEIERLQNAVEKLIRQNEELLRKNSSLQKQGRVIVEEKAAVLKRLEKSEEAYIQLEKLLKETNRTCRDLQQANMLDDEPRFTLAELREVLQEKNVLKGRVMELEEELEVFKPGSARKEFEKLDDTPEPEEKKEPKKIDDDDLPVYGPLPREPDEKLYPWKYERKDSGVRKFFRFIKDWGQPSSPRQPSSAQNSPRPVRSSTSSTLAAVANS